MICRASDGTCQTKLRKLKCQECPQCQDANGKREDKEGQSPLGSERGGGRVIEQGGLRTLDSGIHKSPQVTTLTMFLYNTSRAECSEAGVRRSGAVHGSRVRDLRVFAQMVPHGARA